ncbi:nucleotide exchange factor GrpE [Mycoplasma sp. 3341]|uniref:nucleotide exchange factor GrpE n=1 Tax=Mycoplasma sp. 3341 TaxID=3447506 RepID=UPI003F660233
MEMKQKEQKIHKKSHEKLPLEKFDSLNVEFEVETTKDKNIEKHTKTIVFGFYELGQKVEELLQREAKHIKLDKIYKTEEDNKETKYKLVVKKIYKANSHTKKDREQIEQLRQALLKKHQELVLANLQVLEQKNINEKNVEDFKRKIEEFQQKASEELAAFKAKNYDHMQNEMAENKKYAIQGFVEDILLPLDNIEKAASAGLNSQNPEVQAYTKGFAMLLGQVENVMQNYGISKIIPQVGTDFDPYTQQVFETQDAGLEKEKIIAVKSIGYKLHDRVIKPALVVVQK